jgi:tryptophan 2,3-dioxygenase
LKKPVKSHPPSSKAEEVTYPSYLALEELLQLQRPRSDPEHPDELLFIIVHQASELWFKLILHELGGLIALLEANDTLGALTSVRRVNALVRIVTSSKC